MRKANIYVQGRYAGQLLEEEFGRSYRFAYDGDYQGPPVSLTMPVHEKSFHYNRFPPFFEGLLPEGVQLEGLLRRAKVDRNDLFTQLVAVGADLVGAVTVRGETDEPEVA
jgi:serine/threonine-protein kinase HipA